jgi:hypothetical protein
VRWLSLSLAVAPFFLDPFGQGIPADLVDTGDAAHRHSFLISGDYLFFKLGRCLSRWSIGEGRPTVFAKEALVPRSQVAIALDRFTLAVDTDHDTTGHDGCHEHNLPEKRTQSNASGTMTDIDLLYNRTVRISLTKEGVNADDI